MPRELRQIEKPARIKKLTEDLNKYEKELEGMGDRKISKEGNRKETLEYTIKNLKFQLTQLQS